MLPKWPDEATKTNVRPWEKKPTKSGYAPLLKSHDQMHEERGKKNQANSLVFLKQK